VNLESFKSKIELDALLMSSMAVSMMIPLSVPSMLLLLTAEELE